MRVSGGAKPDWSIREHLRCVLLLGESLSSPSSNGSGTEARPGSARSLRWDRRSGVRRPERRRRRAEEQLVESEANLARVDDILAELRPQAKRLAQQAEQQASRRTAADDLAAAILAAAHARWHAAGARAALPTRHCGRGGRRSVSP